MKNIDLFDHMIADKLGNEDLNPIITKLFIRGRKWNIFVLFITQSHFAIPKNIWVKFTYYFIMETLNKQLIIHQILILKNLLNFTRNVTFIFSN